MGRVGLIPENMETGFTLMTSRVENDEDVIMLRKFWIG
jgi:hypothetical protein